MALVRTLLLVCCAALLPVLQAKSIAPSPPELPSHLADIKQLRVERSEADITPREFECRDEGFYASPDNCSQYFRCVLQGHRLTAFRFQCMEGTVFDETISTCNHPWAVAGPCGHQPFSPLCQQEGFFPDVADHRKFYRCVGNEMLGSFTKYDFQCANGTLFDPVNSSCVHEYDARLGSRIAHAHNHAEATPSGVTADLYDVEDYWTTFNARSGVQGGGRSWQSAQGPGGTEGPDNPHVMQKFNQAAKQFYDQGQIFVESIYRILKNESNLL